MPKTIIINDRIINSGVLKEAIEFNQLPKTLRYPVLKNDTPFTGNSCFPSDNFLEKELMLAFDSVSNTEIVKNGLATPDAISKIEKQCQEIENPFRNNLEQLVSQTVMKFFGIPDDKVDFSVELVDAIDQSRTEIPFGPNENLPADFENPELVDVIKSEVSKRTIQNTLIAGASLAYSRLLLSDVVGMLDEINPQLFDLYNDYFDINDYLLYTANDQITEGDKHETGTVVVTLGNDEQKNQLEAQGTIFPVLLYETIKGFLEICTSHGLPDDGMLCKAVLAKSDYLLAEPWYMRLGPQVWGYFSNILRDVGYYKRSELIPYILMKLSQLDSGKYNMLMREILANTEKANKVMNRVCEFAEVKLERQGFNDRLSTTRAQTAFMIDDEKMI